MIKRTMLFLLSLSVSGVGALAQLPKCATSTKLICQLPVASGSLEFGGLPAFNAALATQLSQLPVVNSSSGLNVEFTAQGPQIVSESLGPIMTDRAETIGRHKLFLGFFYQHFHFNSIDGTNLNDVPLLFVTPPTSGSLTKYVTETNKINFSLNQYVGLITFGLTDKIDVSMVIPIDQVSLGVTVGGNQYFVLTTYDQQGTPTYSQAGQAPFSNKPLPGSASGIGDVVANVKYKFWNGEHFKSAAGMFIRFPSGDALNYLGSGAYGFNPYAVVSYQWKVAPHAKVGYLWNTSTVLIPKLDANGMPTGGNQRLPGGLQYDVGADWSIIRQLTLAGDFFGSQFLNSPYQTLNSGACNIQTFSNGASNVGSCATIPGYNKNYPNLQPTIHSYQVNDFSIGAKWAPFAKKNETKPLDNLILYGNALFQMNNVGLRSKVVPLFGISYKFGL